MSSGTSAYMKNTAFRYINAPAAQKLALRLRRHTLFRAEE